MTGLRLTDAVLRGDLGAVCEALDAGADVGERDVHGKLPLVHAAERGEAQIAQLLLDAGAAVDAPQFPAHGSGTALEYAIGGGHVEVVRLLLARGAQPRGFDLNYAATCAKLETVDLLLDAGAPVNEPNADGSTAVLALCVFGPEHARPLPAVALTRTLSHLIAAGADVNGRDGLGYTPLWNAVFSGNSAAVELLLQAGANPNLRPGCLAVLDAARDRTMAEVLLRSGVDESTREAALRCALHGRRYGIAQAIVNTLADPARGSGRAAIALLEAVNLGDRARLQPALDAAARADPVHDAAALGAAPEKNALAEYGGLALLMAVRSSPSAQGRALIAALLAAGASPNQLALATTPLCAAAAAGDLGLAKILLRAGADPNLREAEGDSALMAALGSADLYAERKPPARERVRSVDAMVQLLVESAADVNARGYEGRTPLLYAIERFPYNIQRLLAAGADVNLATNQGWTPLMIAFDERVVRTLIAAGADPNAATREGQTALHLCITLAKARVLLKAGADPNARDRQGFTPLMAQAQAGRLPLVQGLLEHQADLHAIAERGDTALLAAAISGQYAVARYLAQRGADLKVRNQAGLTVLIAACRAHHPGLLQLALDHGCDLNAQDANGCTGLMYAVQWGYVDTVKLLLARRADVHRTDHKGETALFKARFWNRGDMVELLEERCNPSG